MTDEVNHLFRDCLDLVVFVNKLELFGNEKMLLLEWPVGNFVGNFLD